MRATTFRTSPAARPAALRRAAAVFVGLLSAAAGAQAPPPAGFPGEAPPGPPAQILSFTAIPERVAPGEPVTLRWAAVNAYTLAIDPDLGTVATRGTAAVVPTAATTYTLTVTGFGGAVRQAVTVEVVGGDSAAVAAARPAATGAELPIPRLADGKPDLSGVYLGGRDVRLTSTIRLRSGAEGFRVPPSDEDLGQGALCLPPGVPAATMMPYPLQIVHRPDVVVILYEAYNLFRVIRMTPEHPVDLDPTWMGHSVGRWDGDTLVVDVVGFNDKTLVSGHRHTEAMHVVERYRRTSHEAIEYAATVEDPNVFAEPLTYSGRLILHPEWEIGEYVCAENNKDYAELFTD